MPFSRRNPFRRNKLPLLFLILCLLFASSPITGKTEPTEDRYVSRSITRTLSDAGTFQGITTEAEFVSEPLPVPIDKPEPFLAVAGSWRADAAVPGLVDFDLRFSEDGDTWSGWLHAGLDPHATIEDGLHHGNLVFTGKETRFVQFRMSLGKDENGILPRISEVQLHYISPGATKPSLERILDEKSYQARGSVLSNASKSSRSGDGPGPLAASATFPLPEYVDRETWGQPLGLSNMESRSTTNVTHLIVHHSGSHTTSSDFAAVVRSYWNFHVNSRNWGDIGYNWLVDGNGVVYQGRAFALNGNRDVIGAHFSGHNANTMGICVIGTYTNQLPTNDALSSLAEMLAWKASERGLDPMGRGQHYSPGGNIFRISGHRDSGIFTECPGQRLYNHLPQVRRDVAVLMESWFDPDDVIAEVSWERSFDNGNAFSWMGSGSSETELSIDYHDGTLYIPGNSDGPKIYMIDADFGIQTGVIDITTVLNEAVLGEKKVQDELLSDGFFAATVRVTDDGYLAVSNRTVNAASSRFKVLIINPSGRPSLVDIVYFNEEPWRMGDQLSVSGSVSDGSLDIYAPVSNLGKVVRWTGYDPWRHIANETVADGGTARVLDLDGMEEWGRQAGIAIKKRGGHHGFLAGALMSDIIREYDPEGNPVGFVAFSEGTTNLSALRHGSYQGREYLFAYHPENRQLRWHSLFGSPGDGETDRTAYQLYLSGPLGSTSNRTTISIGDLAVRDNRNGSFDAFILAPNNGIWAYYLEGPEYSGLTSVDEGPGFIPADFRLQQNYPNPFNHSTQIRYELPEPASVRLDVFTATGRHVRTLVSGNQPAGQHQVLFDASGLSSGLYISRLQAGSYVESRKMTLIK